jgi:hypothetical protein
MELVQVETNQTFQDWLAAHADDNYKEQAGIWQFPRNVKDIHSLIQSK